MLMKMVAGGWAFNARWQVVSDIPVADSLLEVGMSAGLGKSGVSFPMVINKAALRFSDRVRLAARGCAMSWNFECCYYPRGHPVAAAKP